MTRQRIAPRRWRRYHGAIGAVAGMGVLALVLVATGRLPAAAAQTTESAPAPVANPSASAPPPDAVAGQETFVDRCAECHGMFGRGDGSSAFELPGPPASFASRQVVWATSPNDAFEIVTNGRMERLMPPWRDELSESQRWDAVYGAWSFYYTPDRIARGQRVWLADCASCHGVDSLSGGSNLTGTAAVTSPWPTDRLLDMSQDEVWQRTLAAAAAHGGVDLSDDERVAAALDYARSTTYAALPHSQLTVDGTVSGRLVLGTDADADLSIGEITAIPVVSGIPGEAVTAAADATGAFTVTGLVAGPDVSHRLLARFDGVDYVLDDDVVLTASSPSRDGVTFEVWQAAPSVPLDVTNGHMLITPRPETATVRVSEVWIVHNGTDTVAVAPGGDATVQMRLPAGAHQIAFADPRIRASARLDGDMLVLGASVFPGENEMAVSYDVPYRGNEVEITRGVNLPVASLQVIAMDSDAIIESDSLGPQRAMAIDAGSVVVAEGGPLAAGSSLDVLVSGLPAAATSAGQEGAMRPAPKPLVEQEALALLGVAVAAAGALTAMVYPLAASRRGGAGRSERVRSEYHATVAQLAALEERKATGATTGPAYAAERADLMSRAVQLARLLDDTGGNG